MKFPKTPLFALAFAAATALMPGCNTTGCTDNQNSVPLAGFYSYTTFEPISVDSIEIGGVGAPADSLLVSTPGSASVVSGPVSQVYLPFRATLGESQFFVRYMQKALRHDELNDTLTFSYTSVPYFASEECGAMYHYRITSLRYTRHLIDSIGLTDSLITNVERETVQIYFRTNEDSSDDDEI